MDPGAAAARAAAGSSLAAEKKLTRDQMVHKDKKDVQQIEEWIYNNLPQAQGENTALGRGNRFLVITTGRKDNIIVVRRPRITGFHHIETPPATGGFHVC